MADKLLSGLNDYRDSLNKHVQQLEQEFDVLNREWLRLEDVYQGDAANEFKNLWVRTSTNFQDYIDRSRRIVRVLEERISFLQESNSLSS